jgi:hypothetical protein
MSDDSSPTDDENPIDPSGDIDVDAVEEGDMAPREVERVFSLLEEATAEDALDGRQLQRLLSVLENSVASPSETNPETFAELVSILEETIIAPENLDEVDVDGLLSVLEEAVAGATTADSESLEELFDVVGEGLTDPTAIEPEDVERFRAGIEDALIDITDSASGGIGGLFPIPGMAGPPPEDAAEADDNYDMFRIARIGAAMTQRATGYSVESGIRTGTRMAYAAANSESPARLITESRAIALDELQRAGVDIGDEQADWLEEHEDDIIDSRPVTAETLRERGERLLSKSAEVGRDETIHPAFPSILEQLAADEARILRLLAEEGTQATMDIRDKKLLPFKSTLVAEKLTMIGSDAGCRYSERTPIYLKNLERLGLIDFSEEPIDDLKQYQVLEAQSHIEAAREAADRPKTVYGSVALSELGIDFCETCLPVSVEAERTASRFRKES